VLTLVSTPIGNLDDITPRALEALRRAEVVLAEDTRVARKLLRLLGERYGFDFGSKRFVALHEHNQRDFLKRVDPSFFEREVVYVSDAGMPALSDPGAMLVRYAMERGIPYTVLPGANAALTAWAASGYEGAFGFFGFLPHKKGRSRRLEEILAHPYHSILYEAPHRLIRLLEEIAAKDPDRELFLAKELTKKHERFYKGRAGELAEELSKEPVKGEWVVIVAPGKREPERIDPDFVMELEIPKKAKAKLLSRVTGEPVAEIYRKLMDD